MWRIHRLIHWLKYSNPWIKFKHYIKYKSFEDREIWNLSDYTAMFMLPRLKALREYHYGVPAHLCKDQSTSDGNNEWNAILDDIILALELQLSPDRGFWGEQAEKDRIIMERGFKLMAENWLSLWD